MFDALKKKLFLGIKKLSEKAQEEKPPEEVQETPEEVIEKPEPWEIPPEEERKEKRLEKLKKKITERILSEGDIDAFFEETQTGFLQANVALEVVDSLRASLSEKLADTSITRGKTQEFITQAFEESLHDIVNQGAVDLETLPQKKKPVTIVFLGFNGSGKTTTIAKIAHMLKKHKHRSVIAAADTFRAASIEQLEYHAEKLKLKVVKHKYGADPAAVVFDAVKHAERTGSEFVLADTAGRMHSDKNLMDELKKIVRVNRPDLKVLVIDSLTGNDAVEQARKFDEAVGVDAVVFTKVDVNKKGGSILTVCHTIKKPVLFLGTGQKYDDLQVFNPQEFVKGLLV